jgi:predicted homoserine dehydrogenase-like protein
MIIVDRALEDRQRQDQPIHVGLVGAGYMGRGIALAIATAVPGMRLAAVASRTVASAKRAYAEAGISEAEIATSVGALEAAIAARRPAIAEDPLDLCRAGNLDVVIDATGEVELGAHVATTAIAHGKHVVLMNAELDATVGPILKVYADRAGVVITYTDGDEPGVAMNLYRFARTIGYRPVLMGQIKGFLDRYRNPDTQRAFAAKHKQKPAMVTSFADGSKLSLESTIMANATGFTVVRRGMLGPRCQHVKDILTHFTVEQLTTGPGFVDFVLGAEPGTGAFVVGYNDHPVLREYMSYFKMGEGPLYVFYTPFHLPHLQLPLSVARAVLFRDATLAPRGAPVCDTLAVAKRDLQVGEILDGMGGFTCYGVIDTWAVCRAANYLPMALSQGCRLLRPVPKDHPITYADVQLPPGRLADKLRAEQLAHFAA